MTKERLLTLGLVILVIFFCIRSCRKQNEIEYLTNLTKKNATGMPTVLIKRNPIDSSIIAEQKQIIISLEQAQEQGLDKAKTEIGTLKKITQSLTLKNEYLIRKLNNKLPEDTIIVVMTDTNCLRLPFQLHGYDKWHHLDLAFFKGGWDYEMSIKDSATIKIGTLKKSFFKHSEPSVVYENKNPYLKDFQMANITIKYKPPFYERPWFNLLVGVGAGILITKTVKP